MLGRRAFLGMVVGGIATVGLGAAGYEAVEAGILPGRLRLAELTGACDVDAEPPASRAELRTGTFASAARARTVGWSLATPPGLEPAGLPAAIALHGRGEDHRAAFESLKLQDFLAAAVLAGTPPFALASVDGGDAYWHPRRDGDDPLAMLRDEFVPLLAGLGLRTNHIAVVGWSMGGYGALLLARESYRSSLGATAVVAAAAASPALFPSFAASAPGAFDSAADFALYGELIAQPDVGDTPLFVSCGADDAFTDATKRYRSNVSPNPAGGISKGCHTAGYWRSVAGRQLAFVGARLGAST